MLIYLIYIERNRHKNGTDKDRDLYVDISLTIIVDIIAIYYFISNAKTIGVLFPPYDAMAGFTGLLDWIAPYMYVILIVLGGVYSFLCFRYWQDNQKTALDTAEEGTNQ